MSLEGLKERARMVRRLCHFYCHVFVLFLFVVSGIGVGIGIGTVTCI